VNRCLWLLALAASIAGPGLAFAEQFPIHGFAQAASAYRLIQPDGCPPTQRLACEESFILGEGRVRLELAPRGKWWALNAKTELIYDAVGREVSVSLREGYLDLRFPALDLRIGRQIITWGVGDLIFINDVFPKDWAAFISGLPLEYLKKGSDAVSATAHWAGSSLQLVLAPHFVADTVPEAGGRLAFYDPAGSIETRTTDDPPASIENLELGLRAFRNLVGWDVSLYAYRGFFHTPAVEVEPGPALRLFYPPLNVYGASAQGAALGGVVSFEAGYYDARSDRSGRNPAVENSSTRLLAGYQREVVPDLEPGYGLAFLDVDKVGYPELLDPLARLVRVGGLLVADNVLWQGQVPRGGRTPEAVALREYNRRLAQDPRFLTAVLPLRDGVSVALKTVDG